jgi:hypothetical protein
MNIQDLKNNRNEIIVAITEKGLDVKKVMTLMSMDVDFTTATNWEELLQEVINTHFRERAKRSGQKLAEIVGTKEQREGLEESYTITKYL